LGESTFILEILDDYFIFTSVFFLKDKTKAFKEFSKWCRNLQVSKHGREFD